MSATIIKMPRTPSGRDWLRMQLEHNRRHPEEWCRIEIGDASDCDAMAAECEEAEKRAALMYPNGIDFGDKP